ncbi:MAG: hypothetical protein NC200_04270 [Candidatus Gastranaerophilales bacterium]|nr:hypothetical protein [Candidatus Gastranaerophilales bacterium]
MDILTEVKIAIKCTEEKEYKKAEKIYLNILKLDENNAIILSFLGLLYMNMRLFKKAKKYLLKSYELKDNNATVEGLGLVCYYLGEYAKACKYLEIAIKTNKSFDIYDKLIQSLQETKSFSKSYEYALECYSKYPLKKEALSNLAMSSISVGRLKETQNYAEQLVKKYPKYDMAWYLLGLINEMLYHNDVFAEECYKKILKCGNKALGYYNLIVNSSKQQKYDKALYYIKKYSKYDSCSADMNFILSTVYFFKRKFKRAYKHYALKEKNSQHFNKASLLKNIWDGKKYKDETLLVYCDQGIGDYIMFSRYLPFLEKKFKRIKVYTNKSVLKLFKRSFKQCKNMEFLPFKVRFPHYDKSAILSNLPYYLKMSLDNIPSTSGYMLADNKKIEAYHEKYFNNDKLKVGLCWEAGAAGWREQLNRTLNISMFESLFDVEHVQFYSLQVKPSLDNYKNYDCLVDLGSTFKNFDDTAAALKNLDIVVTVDTSVAHLAGALGVKTFMLLPYCPDWRWFDCEHDTDWYDSVRIFKQKGTIFWDDEISKIKTEIIKLAKTNRLKA